MTDCPCDESNISPGDCQELHDYLFSDNEARSTNDSAWTGLMDRAVTDMQPHTLPAGGQDYASFTTASPTHVEDSSANMDVSGSRTLHFNPIGENTFLNAQASAGAGVCAGAGVGIGVGAGAEACSTDTPGQHLQQSHSVRTLLLDAFSAGMCLAEAAPDTQETATAGCHSTQQSLVIPNGTAGSFPPTPADHFFLEERTKALWLSTMAAQMQNAERQHFTFNSDDVDTAASLPADDEQDPPSSDQGVMTGKRDQNMVEGRMAAAAFSDAEPPPPSHPRDVERSYQHLRAPRPQPFRAPPVRFRHAIRDDVQLCWARFEPTKSVFHLQKYDKYPKSVRVISMKPSGEAEWNEHVQCPQGDAQLAQCRRGGTLFLVWVRQGDQADVPMGMSCNVVGLSELSSTIPDMSPLKKNEAEYDVYLNCTCNEFQLVIRRTFKFKKHRNRPSSTSCKPPCSSHGGRGGGSGGGGGRGGAGRSSRKPTISHHQYFRPASGNTDNGCNGSEQATRCAMESNDLCSTTAGSGSDNVSAWESDGEYNSSSDDSYSSQDSTSCCCETAGSAGDNVNESERFSSGNNADTSPDESGHNSTMQMAVKRGFPGKDVAFRRGLWLEAMTRGDACTVMDSPLIRIRSKSTPSETPDATTRTLPSTNASTTLFRNYDCQPGGIDKESSFSSLLLKLREHSLLRILRCSWNAAVQVVAVLESHVHQEEAKDVRDGCNEHAKRSALELSFRVTAGILQIVLLLPDLTADMLGEYMSLELLVAVALCDCFVLKTDIADPTLLVRLLSTLTASWKELGGAPEDLSTSDPVFFKGVLWLKAAHVSDQLQHTDPGVMKELQNYFPSCYVVGGDENDDEIFLTHCRCYRGQNSFQQSLHRAMAAIFFNTHRYFQCAGADGGVHMGTVEMVAEHNRGLETGCSAHRLDRDWRPVGRKLKPVAVFPLITTISSSQSSPNGVANDGTNAAGTGLQLHADAIATMEDYQTMIAMASSSRPNTAGSHGAHTSQRDGILPVTAIVGDGHTTEVYCRSHFTQLSERQRRLIWKRKKGTKPPTSSVHLIVHRDDDTSATWQCHAIVQLQPTDQLHVHDRILQLVGTMSSDVRVLDIGQVGDEGDEAAQVRDEAPCAKQEQPSGPPHQKCLSSAVTDDTSLCPVQVEPADNSSFTNANKPLPVLQSAAPVKRVNKEEGGSSDVSASAPPEHSDYVMATRLSRPGNNIGWNCLKLLHDATVESPMVLLTAMNGDSCDRSACSKQSAGLTHLPVAACRTNGNAWKSFEECFHQLHLGSLERLLLQWDRPITVITVLSGTEEEEDEAYNILNGVFGASLKAPAPASPAGIGAGSCLLASCHTSHNQLYIHLSFSGMSARDLSTGLGEGAERLLLAAIALSNVIVFCGAELPGTADKCLGRMLGKLVMQLPTTSNNNGIDRSKMERQLFNGRLLILGGDHTIGKSSSDATACSALFASVAIVQRRGSEESNQIGSNVTDSGTGVSLPCLGFCNLAGVTHWLLSDSGTKSYTSGPVCLDHLKLAMALAATEFKSALLLRTMTSGCDGNFWRRLEGFLVLVSTIGEEEAKNDGRWRNLSVPLLLPTKLSSSQPEAAALLKAIRANANLADECSSDEALATTLDTFASVKASLKSIVSRRCATALAVFSKEVPKDGEYNAAIDMLRSIVDKFRAAWVLCGNRCDQCHDACLLLRGHDDGCDCLNTSHACVEPCSMPVWDNGVAMAACSKMCTLGHGHGATERGHAAVHCCEGPDRLLRHRCRKRCWLDDSRGCESRCYKRINHDDVHQCAVPRQLHLCAMPCRLACRPLVRQEGDAALLPGRHPRCHRPAKHHGHDHLCGEQHECPEMCDAPGVCFVADQPLTAPEDSRKLPVGRNGYKLTCRRSLPAGKSCHENEHKCGCRHRCSTSCPLCDTFCSKQYGHAGLHSVEQHGPVLDVAAVAGGVLSVSAQRPADLTCNTLCTTLGRGHTHLLNNSSVGPDEKATEVFSHQEFWRSQDFADPCCDEESQEFQRCPVQCSACVETGAPLNFCSQFLFHETRDAIDQDEEGYVSHERDAALGTPAGHHFVCQVHHQCSAPCVAREDQRRCSRRCTKLISHQGDCSCGKLHACGLHCTGVDCENVCNKSSDETHVCACSDVKCQALSSDWGVRRTCHLDQPHADTNQRVCAQVQHCKKECRCDDRCRSAAEGSLLTTHHRDNVGAVDVPDVFVDDVADTVSSSSRSSEEIGKEQHPPLPLSVERLKKRLCRLYKIRTADFDMSYERSLDMDKLSLDMDERSLNMDERSLDMDEIYANLHVVSRDDLSGKMRTTADEHGSGAGVEKMTYSFQAAAKKLKKVKLGRIFHIQPPMCKKMSRESVLVLALSCAGGGKTMLFTKKAPRDWAKRQIWKSIDLLFAVELRSTEVRQAKSPMELLGIKKYGIVNVDDYLVVDNYIHDNPEHVCIVLDGLDETKLDDCSDFVKGLIKGECLQGVRIIVTSRHSSEVRKLASQTKFHLCLELLGFQKEEVDCCIHNVPRLQYARQEMSDLPVGKKASYDANGLYMDDASVKLPVVARDVLNEKMRPAARDGNEHVGGARVEKTVHSFRAAAKKGSNESAQHLQLSLLSEPERLDSAFLDTTVQIWDLGGQFPMSSQHCIYLDTSRSGFLLVVDATKPMKEPATEEVLRYAQGEWPSMPIVADTMDTRCQQLPPAVLHLHRKLMKQYERAEGTMDPGSRSEGVSISTNFVNLRIIPKSEFEDQTFASSRDVRLVEHTLSQPAGGMESTRLESLFSDVSEHLAEGSGTVGVLAVSSSGNGKTHTFTKVAPMKWAMNVMWPEFDILSVRELRHESVRKAKGISELLGLKDIGMEECSDRQAICDYIRKYPERLCLVLDGLDETSLSDCSSFVEGVICGATLPGIRLIVTSRPCADASALSKLEQSPCQVEGFQPEDVDNYIRAVLHPGEGSALIEKVKSEIHLQELMATPFFAADICEQYQCEDYIPLTLTARYEQRIMQRTTCHTRKATQPKLERTQSRDQTKIRRAEIVDFQPEAEICISAALNPEKDKALIGQAIPQEFLLDLGKFAFDMLNAQRCPVLSEYDNQNNEICHEAIALGLLVPCDHCISHDAPKQWRFRHVTLQESLAAKYLARHAPKQCQVSCLTLQENPAAKHQAHPLPKDRAGMIRLVESLQFVLTDADLLYLTMLAVQQDHLCPATCPLCRKSCHLQAGHQSTHQTEHGTILLDKKIRVATAEGKRLAFASDISCAQVCVSAGRGHVHMYGECSGQELCPANAQHIRDFSTKGSSGISSWKKKRIHVMSHSAFWEVSGFRDPYPSDQVELFQSCGAKCPEEHQERPVPRCSGKLWHKSFAKSGADGGYLAATEDIWSENRCLVVHRFEHDRHKCAKRCVIGERCDRQCIEQLHHSCTAKCHRDCAGLGDTGHVDGQAFHHCGQTHKCQAMCRARGVCVLADSPHQEAPRGSVRIRPDGNGYKLPCCVPVPPGQRNHSHVQLKHQCGGDHTCDRSCPLCHHYCHKMLSHAGPCHTKHGSIVDLQKATVTTLSGEILDLKSQQVMTCDTLCDEAGPSHAHVAPSNGSAREEGCKFMCGEDQNRKPVASISHDRFWKKVIQFEDPYTGHDLQEHFSRCPAECPYSHEEHHDGNIHCTAVLFHGNLREDECEAGRGFATTEKYGKSAGHHFACKHLCQLQCELEVHDGKLCAQSCEREAGHDGKCKCGTPVHQCNRCCDGKACTSVCRLDLASPHRQHWCREEACLGTCLRCEEPCSLGHMHVGECVCRHKQHSTYSVHYELQSRQKSEDHKDGLISSVTPNSRSSDCTSLQPIRCAFQCRHSSHIEGTGRQCRREWLHTKHLDAPLPAGHRRSKRGCVFQCQHRCDMRCAFASKSRSCERECALLYDHDGGCFCDAAQHVCKELCDHCTAPCSAILQDRLPHHRHSCGDGNECDAAHQFRIQTIRITPAGPSVKEYARSNTALDQPRHSSRPHVPSQTERPSAERDPVNATAVVNVCIGADGGCNCLPILSLDAGTVTELATPACSGSGDEVAENSDCPLQHSTANCHDQHASTM